VVKPLIVLSVPFKGAETSLSSLNAPEADLVELRLDYADTLNLDLLGRLEDFKRKLLLTVRDVQEGGVRPIPPEAKRSFLVRAIDKGFTCDVEAHFARNYGVPHEGQIVSFHSLQRTPTLDELKRELYDFRETLLKIVVPAKGGYRSLLTGALEIFPNCAVMPYGGDPLERIAFSLLGSKLIYAFSKEKTAEGQLELKRARKLVEALFGRT